MSEQKSSSSSKKSFPWKIVIIVLVIAALFSLKYFLPFDEWMKQLGEWIKSLGFWAPFAYIAVYVVFTVLLLPASALTLLSGVFFSLPLAITYTVIAANLAANIAFFIGRYLARDKIEAKISGNEKFAAIDNAVAKDGWKIVALTRLAPVFPFTLLNYAYGLTKVKWSSYALATFFAMLPGTAMFVYLGAIGRFAAEGAEKTTGEKVFFVVGLVAIIAVTVYITKLAKKILNQKTDIETESESDGSSDSE